MSKLSRCVSIVLLPKVDLCLCWGAGQRHGDSQFLCSQRLSLWMLPLRDMLQKRVNNLPTVCPRRFSDCFFYTVCPWVVSSEKDVKEKGLQQILFYFIFLIFFFLLFMIVTESEWEAETQAEGEAGSMHQEPDVGFDPGSPGSRPGPKAGAKPLRHPGIPIIYISITVK